MYKLHASWVKHMYNEQIVGTGTLIGTTWHKQPTALNGNAPKAKDVTRLQNRIAERTPAPM